MPIPKPQLYPVSKIAVGAVLYSCSAWTDEAGKISTEVNEWVVRSIQAKRGTKSRMGFATSWGGDTTQFVNLTEKIDGLTWGKRSTKNGDYGWLKTIPGNCRKQFSVGGLLPRGIYTTIRAAVLFEIRSTEDMIARCKATDIAERDEADNEELANYEAELAALKRRRNKLNSRPAGASQSEPVVA